ncbi:MULTISPECIES: hypothetical protein [Dietzia]|uniref:hypothetical protein n=1 Tax=Dietzia TaxID=37914 RepID=UPI00135AB634|nr:MULTISPECIES: hypothetical protein [Dietzia]USX46802.1 hypothetical protein NHB83_04860 [Dietzia kunjamensis]
MHHRETDFWDVFVRRFISPKNGVSYALSKRWEVTSKRLWAEQERGEQAEKEQS